MTFTQKITACAVATFGIFAASTAANAQAGATAYAIGNNGTTLITFNVANPGAATVVGTFSGAPGLDAIDFRPANGVLYGYNDITDTLYTVNTTTAALTVVATSAGTASATNSGVGGLDFNPMIDRVRYVNDASRVGTVNPNNNIVYNPNSAAIAAVQTDLVYATGDSGADGTGASVVENAYTNNLAGATATQQYAIDNARGTLVTLANAAGTLNTVGTLGLGTAPNLTTPAISSFAGFDIFTSLTGVNTAYGIFGTNAGNGIGSSFYNVNLTTGLATPTGSFNSSLGSVYSLAVVPTVVPEGSTGVLLGMGAGLLGMVGVGIRRRLSK